MTENKQILMTESLQQNVSEKRLTHYMVSTKVSQHVVHICQHFYYSVVNESFYSLPLTPNFYSDFKNVFSDLIVTDELAIKSAYNTKL